ncbi:aldehyde dehydrogenase family protein [Thioalkalivibrio nitratireducens DSM 14787]|uniref:Aldehyde dehydrogenase family protein n=1 Tax=Thioalkalivibrio nitratireducens (strain DSM 14787 / UNIQEM 213 / ALEN2) TaxID=1255043 RepID=L0DWE6_THIND|nr:aldehyde dehydrogenase family protein [Thioalkalivibrio nitratireducens]AGA32691.1 aldehyde dehydrogenase family protein [Thioalkalivibrio nitratireducens DSM 14787]
MPELFESLIAGEHERAGRLTVFAPFDRMPIAEVETVGEAGVGQALDTAYRLFRDRRGWLPVHRRIEILERTAQILHERAEALALEAAREGGKPLIDSRVEVARSIDSIRLCVECLRTDGGEVVPMDINTASAGRHAFTMPEPIGVVVAVSAFNHPLNLIAHQVGPAVAAGCPVIAKPAEDTPLSCFRFVGILREAGLPEEWCQALMTRDLDVAMRLVTDPRVGFLSFIGSAKVGWKLRSMLAPGTRCALEHGGAAPVIVVADADLDAAIPRLAKGGFYHAGQVCVSVQRIFADRAIAGEFAARLADAADRLRIGDPTLPDTEVGPLIREADVQRVEDWVREAEAGGARVLAGGEARSNSTYACTVLEDPAPDARVSTDEVFGPVVCVYPFDDLDAAAARANGLRWAFQAAVFTRDMATAMQAAHGLDASAVMVNDHTAFRVDWMPFAGLRESGLGVGGIPHTLRDMQVRKLIVIQ